MTLEEQIAEFGPRRQRRGGDQFSPSTYREIEVLGPTARAAIIEAPGRYSNHVAPPKPTAEETPYRSRMFVLPKSSADGNAYRPDDPIPVEEAERQGIPIIDGPVEYQVPPMYCSKCRGSGVRMRGHGPSSGHRAGCPGCKPCIECLGTGRIERKEENDPVRHTQRPREFLADVPGEGSGGGSGDEQNRPQLPRGVEPQHALHRSPA